MTGTNGKTSTSNMIVEMFEQKKDKVISNRKGDNLRAGITTSLFYVLLHLQEKFMQMPSFWR